MTTRVMLLLASVVVVLGLIVVGMRQGPTAPPPLMEGGPGTIQLVANPVELTEVTMQDLDGRTISSRDWRGKVTIVNYWATWCRPCIKEIPELVRLQDRYRDYLQIIGISADEGSPDRVKQFAQEHGINYPVVMDTPELRRSFPGVFALPTSFVIDREGRTVQKHVGLISPSVFEHETRFLAGLPTDVIVERVDDTGQVLLSNAAQATEIPGLDLSELSPEQKTAALQRLNTDRCTCACELTLAQCRINDADCQFSLPIAEQVVEEIRAGGRVGL